MIKPKSIVVRSDQNLELSDRTVSALGGVFADLRPRTPDALRTLLGENSKKPARLHDAKSFEHLGSRAGHTELLADKTGRFQGFSISNFMAIVRALPSGAAIPKTVDLSRLKRGCGCSNAHHGPAARHDSPATDGYELALPDWFTKLQIFRRVAFFFDIVVERGAILTLSYPTIAARHFILHTGGRVKQRVSVVMDLSGSFRVGAAADARSTRARR